MKAVILAGGYGTRISEETHLRPKPMVEIGGRPILWHILKLYSHFGINDFIICLGYKGYLIKEYFTNYHSHLCDMTIDIQSNERILHSNKAEPWRVTLVDTGVDTMTGGRLKRVAPHLQDEDAFCLTYGDGLSDVNINELVDFHGSHGKMATLTAVKPPERFGVLELDNGETVKAFREKPQSEAAYINGGFFVLSPEVLNYIDGDNIPWEGYPLQTLAAESQLKAYKHLGFWQCMDTLRDRTLLEEMDREGRAPWKLWE